MYFKADGGGDGDLIATMHTTYCKRSADMNFLIEKASLGCLHIFCAQEERSKDGAEIRTEPKIANKKSALRFDFFLKLTIPCQPNASAQTRARNFLHFCITALPVLLIEKI